MMRKNSIRIGLIGGLLALTLLLLPGEGGIVSAKGKETGSGLLTGPEGTIPQGVSIEGEDVSGKTSEEAAATVNTYLLKFTSAPITLKAGEKSLETSAGEIGVTARNNDICQRALLYGKEGTPGERFKAESRLKKGKGKDFSLSLGLDTGVTEDFLKAHEKDLASPAVDNGLKHEGGEFVFVPGKEGTKISIGESVAAIEDYIHSDWDGKKGEVTLFTEKEEPKGDEKALKSVHDLLGTFTTDYHTSSADRKINVARGAQLMNGRILYPGDIISVHESVSPITVENGYASAGAYVNGQVVESEGGGICQVATTTYNAVLRAELAIETRAAHSLTVHYVDLSFDAAIASSPDGAALKDLKFRNNQKYPVYIEELTNGSKITVNIYGKEVRDPDRKVTYESETLKEIKPTNTIHVDGAAPLGLTRISGGTTGYRARLWKIVTVGGKEESRKVQNNSSYQMKPGEYTVGTMGADPSSAAAIQAAAATGDIDQVKAVLASAKTTPPAGTAPAGDQTGTGTNEGTGSKTAPTGGEDSDQGRQSGTGQAEDPAGQDQPAA